MDWWWLLLLLLAFAMGVSGTSWLRHYALRYSLLDVPNQRSSHSRPTPRGGGLSITLVVLFVIVVFGATGNLPGAVFIALFPAAFLVALIAWLEDHTSVPIIIRGVGYLIAALWFVSSLGGMPEISLGTVEITNGVGDVSSDRTAETDVFSYEDGVSSLGTDALRIPALLTGLILVLGIAWLTNLYNFMDGTDGLAGLQAVLAGLAGGFLLLKQGEATLALLSLAAAAAAGGFLVWNWPPATIFMGDVGSCLLGFLFGCLAVLGEKYAGLPALVWVILLGFFIWDATLTLLMRICSSESWYSAHKSHAYQKLVQLGLSHGELLWLLFGFNVLVLWPLAWWGYRQPDYLLTATGLSAVLVGLLWLAVQMYYKRMFSGS